MKLKRILIILAMLVLCSVAFAQDAASTEEAAPVVVNVEPAAGDGSIWGLVLVVAGGFVGVIGAISFGLQIIGNRAKAASNNPLEVAVLEKAHDSLPSAVVMAVIEPLKASLERSDEALRNALELLRKVTDRIPESEKPQTAESQSAGYHYGDPPGSVGSGNTFASTVTHNLPSPATTTPTNG